MTPKQLKNYKTLFKKISGKRLRGEDELSRQVNIWLRHQVLAGIPIVFFHVPNESKRTVQYARKLETIGLIPGAPDFVISSSCISVFLELKAPGKRTRLSESQKAFREWASDVGIPYHVATSLDEVKEIFKKEFSGITDFCILGN